MSTPSTSPSVVKHVYTFGSPAVLIFLAFFAAKVTGLIGWNWWLVCLPLYFYLALLVSVVAIAIAVIAAVALCAGFVLLIAWAYEAMAQRRQAKRRATRRAVL